MQPAYSLQKRLIVYVSIFSVLLGCLLIFAAYRIALEEINEILNAQMQNLAEHVAKNNPQPEQSKIDLTQHYGEEDLFIDVWRYDHPQEHPEKILVDAKQQADFYEHISQGEIWYTYVLPLKEVQIQISQPKFVRQSLALELAANMFIPYVLFIPFALWALKWLIQRNFHPLNRFKAELSQRKAQELTPISNQDYPVELLPTIQEINQLFTRISLAQQEQRQFIADAAHELRTPLTALNLQLKILLQQFPQSDALGNLSQGVLRMQHLVNQLLNLAKQDATHLIEATEILSLNQTTLACVEQLIQLALQKEIDLGVEQQEEILIQGQASALHSIIYNLIDNAIKYTPQQGIINIQVLQQNDYAILQVEDSGQGIASEQFQHIRQRFYRIHNHAEMGSGLGLSIVDKATERLHGELRFLKSNQLGGLCVQVKFPLYRAE